MVLDLHFKEELWVEEINLEILVIWMVTKVLGMIGCYHLLRMKVREEIWAWGYTFKFQAENNEPEEMTKKEHLERQEKNKTKQNKTQRACCRSQGKNCQDFNDVG